jgi:hypothetical protein
VKGGESEIWLERLTYQGGEKLEGGGLGVLGNSGQTVGSDCESAAGEEFGKLRQGVDGGGTRKFPIRVVGREEISSAGIGKNAKQGDFRELLGDRVGAADGKNRAGPGCGHPLGGRDGCADSGKGARADPDNDLICWGGIRKRFLE